MKRLFKILIAGILALLCSDAYAEPNTRINVRDSLVNELPSIHNSADSLRILLDIFDLSINTPECKRAAELAYKAAVNARDTAEIIETGIYRVAYAQTDTILGKHMREELLKLDQSPKTREALLYIDFILSENRLKDNPLSHKEVAALLREVQSNPQLDPYEKAHKLYVICYSLGRIARGGIYGECVNQFMNVINSMHLQLGIIRSLAYNRMAPIYTKNLAADKAVEADKALLNVIDSLSTSYYMRGRKYHNMSHSRYVCYLRMLCNYRVLSPTEIEIFNRSIHKLAQSNEAIAKDLEENPRVDALYLTATKKYKEAVPLLKKVIDHEDNSIFRYVLYSSLLEASQAIGDNKTSLEAALQLNKMMLDIIENRAEDRFGQVEFITDINELQTIESELNASRHQANLRTTHIIIAISFIALVLLLILIVTFLRHNKKMKGLTASLQKSTDRLRKERNDLSDTRSKLIEVRDMAQSAEKLKDEFIDNISHEIKVPLNAVSEYTRLIVDCIPDNKNSYLQRYANIVELNTELVLRLVDDLLDVSSLEHNNMSVNICGTSVHKVAQVAIGSVFETDFNANSKIKVIFNPSQKPDEIINTDGQRMGQVLINLLANARKFTEKGTITLDYDIDREAGKIIFSVTDTGCGIPAGREETIFGRFNKLDASAPGPGIGLYISRLIARLLDGSVTLDKTYRRGARFLFELPI